MRRLVPPRPPARPDLSASLLATVGTAPNRTFVAEWIDGTFFPAAGAVFGLQSGL